MDPDLFSRRRIESNQRIVACQDIHHTIHDDGIEIVNVVVTSLVGPSHLELVDVRFGDLVYGDIVRVVGTSAVIFPSLAVLWLSGGK